MTATVSPLDGFFEAMAPMLGGTIGAAEVEARLGPSASGTAALGFYGELVRRNHHKILCDVFPSLRCLVERTEPGRWATLCAAYAQAHPGRGADPNRFAEAFSGWLAQTGDAPAIWTEIADYEWTRVAVYYAPDDPHDPDGFDVRIVVRQYTHDIPTFARRLQSEAAEPLPPPSPTLVIVHRDLRTGALALYRPRVAALAALAHRRGMAWPDTAPMVTKAQRDAAMEALVEAGVLRRAKTERGE